MDNQLKAVVTNILLVSSQPSQDEGISNLFANPSTSAQFLLIFGMTCSTRFKDIKSKVSDKTGILVGLGCQFFLMPLVGFVVYKVSPP